MFPVILLLQPQDLRGINEKCSPPGCWLRSIGSSLRSHLQLLDGDRRLHQQWLGGETTGAGEGLPHVLVDGGACWQSSYMRRRPRTKSLARHPGSSPKIHTTKIINIITNNIFRDAFPHRLLPLKGHGAGSVHVFFLVKGSPVGLTKITTSPDWSTRHPRWGPRCCWCQLSYAIKPP